MLVLVKLGDNDRAVYFNGNDLSINTGDNVIVDTEKGLQYGVVKALNNDEFDTSLYKNVVRVATSDDVKKNDDNINDAMFALKKCRKLVQKYGLNMKIIDAYYTFMREQLIFRFVSEDRVDFRNLAKELGAIYKTRIELRQIGVRDKAKKVGGYGSCGQKLCCARFLNDFDSISISMAKNQNISLNPNKINGLCGRLLCCLKYENECYKECKKMLPKIGEIKEVDNKKGVIKSVNLIKGTYTLEFPNGELLEVKQDYGRN